MRKYIVVLFVLISGGIASQELNATVEFNTSQVGATNQQVFKTLKKSLTEFLNNTKWAEKTFKKNEKINCSFFFNITSYDNVNKFEGSLQVQASRPVFNSTYSTSILNINDKEVKFEYTEFQNLNFNINSYDSNLLSVIAFYANMIIGIDADSFQIEGGNKAFENASTIVALAQITQEKAWTSNGTQNRYYLVNDMIAPTYLPFRRAIYEYHLGALDIMANNPKEGKENIKRALKSLTEVAAVRPNAYLTRVFFDAKSDEILNIFTDGPKVDVTQVIESLNRLSPTNSSKWGQISY
ncbi:DUF4835 family protein [Flavobacterium amnicola]|uniref:DUF4835 family protein n=1 Tax=Flavobacterium amnicola TaxID=2506422 RepID=A0A4Q1K2S0_9FLAO|nr:DUF4835 family protein [Flavobacterium amnicola]RXR19245.1 DUF4835 family protein [Flavobacterium amnicola]